jgi:hypothetical protein
VHTPVKSHAWLLCVVQTTAWASELFGRSLDAAVPLCSRALCEAVVAGHAHVVCRTFWQALREMLTHLSCPKCCLRCVEP